MSIIAAGTTQITADKAADATHTAQQVSYKLHLAPRAVDVTAWIGPADSEIKIAPVPIALDLAHSSDLHCDPAQVLTCANGAQSETTSTTLTDATTTTTQPSIYWLKHGPNTTDGINLPGQMFLSTMVGGAVAFNGRLWTVTADQLGSGSDEAWSTSDGVNWRLEASDVLGSTYQTEFRLLVNNNALWVIVGSPVANEVWRSADGKTWTQVTAAANFPARELFGAAAFNGRLWIMGGAVGSLQELNDVWSSADGITWTQNSAAALSGPRRQAEMIVFNNRLWVIGGAGNGHVYTEAWSSADGSSWTLETGSPAFGGRFAEHLMTDGTHLWLFGGFDETQMTFRTDVWTSTDGKNWSMLKDSFLNGFNFGAAWWKNQLLVMDLARGHVWSSATGVDWIKLSTNARIPDFLAVTGVGYRGRLWIVTDSLRLLSSSDGLSWRQEVALMPGTTSTPQLIALADRLILICGLQFSPPFTYYREVWQSVDGHTWTKASNNIPISAGNLYQAVVYNSQILLFGENAGNNATSEIWSSADGANWGLVTATPSYAPRTALQLLPYGGKLYAAVFGNSVYDPVEIWSSMDGASWTLVSGTTALPTGSFANSLAFSNSMCLYNSFTPHDGWCSPDGVAWTKRTDDAPYGVMLFVDQNAYAIAYTKDFWFANDFVFRSTDGVTWRLGYHNTMEFP